MAVEAGVIFGWPLDILDLPPGWSRVTSLDGRFPRGPADSDVSGGFNGGSATHTHTSPPHGHTADSHNHIILSSPGTVGGECLVGLLAAAAAREHVHQATTGFATPTIQNETVIIDVATNEPAYGEVIWIESDGSSDIPILSVGFWDNDPSGPPPNWFNCDGGLLPLPRPDFRDRILRGATGLLGGLTGGSDTHTHAPNLHTHIEDEHEHSTPGGVGGADPRVNVANLIPSQGNIVSALNHTHSINDPTATTVALVNPSTVTLSSSSSEPPWRKLLCIQNQNILDDLPLGIIGLWLGLKADIPSRWTLCDGRTENNLTTQDMRDLFCKCAVDTLEIGDVGGVSSHTHTADPHLHTEAPHQHVVTGGGVSSFDTLRRNLPAVPPVDPAIHQHFHDVWLAGPDPGGIQNTVIVIDPNSSDDILPLYTEAFFIKLTNLTLGGKEKDRRRDPITAVPLVWFSKGDFALASGETMNFTLPAVDHVTSLGMDMIPPRTIRGTLRGRIEDVSVVVKQVPGILPDVRVTFYSNSSFGSDSRLMGDEELFEEFIEKTAPGGETLYEGHASTELHYQDDSDLGNFYVSITNESQLDISEGDIIFHFSLRFGTPFQLT